MGVGGCLKVCGGAGRCVVGGRAYQRWRECWWVVSRCFLEGVYEWTVEGEKGCAYDGSVYGWALGGEQGRARDGS